MKQLRANDYFLYFWRKVFVRTQKVFCFTR